MDVTAWALNLSHIRCKELGAIANGDVDISVTEYLKTLDSLKKLFEFFFNSIANKPFENNELDYINNSFDILFNSAYKVAWFTDAKNIYMDKPDFKLDDQTSKRALYLYNNQLALFYYENSEYLMAIKYYNQMLNDDIDESIKPVPDCEVKLNLGIAYSMNGDYENAKIVLESLFSDYSENKLDITTNDDFTDNYSLLITNLAIFYRTIKDYSQAIIFDKKRIDITQSKIEHADYTALLISYSKALCNNIHKYTEKSPDGTIIEQDIATEREKMIFVYNQQFKDWLSKEHPYKQSYTFIHLVILTRNIELISKLVKQNIVSHTIDHPSKVEFLYQYKSISSAKKTIINQTIYLNNPTNFNDYTDPFYRLFDDEYTKMSYDEVINKLGIACLTTKNDNLLMWSHYSDSHRGVCIKYKIPSKIVNNKHTLCKVSYTSRPIIINGDVFTDPIVDDDSYKPVSFVEQLATKSREWKYEDEYRIIGWNDNEEDRTIKTEIEAVYMGKEISNEDKIILQMLAKEYHFYLYQMKTSSSNLRSLKDELIYSPPLK